jgi:hypothetical protein
MTHEELFIENQSLLRLNKELLRALKEADIYFDNWCQDEPTAQKPMQLVRKAIANAGKLVHHEIHQKRHQRSTKRDRGQ